MESGSNHDTSYWNNFCSTNAQRRSLWKTSPPLPMSVSHKRCTCFPALSKLWSPLQNHGSFLRKGKEIKSNKGSCWLETHAVDAMLNSSTRPAAFFHCFFYLKVIKWGTIPIIQPSVFFLCSCLHRSSTTTFAAEGAGHHMLCSFVCEVENKSYLSSHAKSVSIQAFV